MSYVEGSAHLCKDNFFTRDFLTVAPGQLRGAPFSAIVGNPPYTRHHWIKGRQRAAAEQARAQASFSISRASSMWAYFVAHSLHFLREGGRLAFLLPESLIQADYGRLVLDGLARHFRQVDLIRIQERIFEGTNEAVVAVAACGKGPGIVRLLDAERASDLVPALCGELGHPTEFDGCSGLRGEIDADCVNLLAKLRDDLNVRPFGDIADVRLGVVTGASDFFVLSRDEIREKGLSHVKRWRIVAKTRHLSGLRFMRDDHEALISQGAKVELLVPTRHPRSKRVKSWVQEGRRAGIHERYKCSIRDPWFRVGTSARPCAAKPPTAARGNCC